MEYCLKSFTFTLASVFMLQTTLLTYNLAASPVDDATNIDMYTGSDPECDKICDEASNDPTVFKDSQLSTQCKAYKMSEVSLYIEYALLPIDASAFALCTAACFNPAMTTACDIADIASGVAEVSSTVMQHVVFQQEWQTGEYVSLALGAAGIFMGVRGLRK